MRYRRWAAGAACASRSRHPDRRGMCRLRMKGQACRRRCARKRSRRSSRPKVAGLASDCRSPDASSRRTVDTSESMRRPKVVRWYRSIFPPAGDLEAFLDMAGFRPVACTSARRPGRNLALQLLNRVDGIPAEDSFHQEFRDLEGGLRGQLVLNLRRAFLI